MQDTRSVNGKATLLSCLVMLLYPEPAPVAAALHDPENTGRRAALSPKPLDEQMVAVTSTAISVTLLVRSKSLPDSTLWGAITFRNLC